MRYLLFAFALLALCAPVGAQDSPRPTVDQLAGKIADIRAKRADLEKQEQAAIADLRTELKRQADLIEKLGLLDGPQPKPVPPVPVDPLKAKLKAAFDASAGTTAEKAEHAKDLAALYREASKLVADPALVTAATLRQKLKDASAVLIGPDALKEVRQAVALVLAGVLPTTDSDLTNEQRTAAAALFARLAAVLEEIAK